MHRFDNKLSTVAYASRNCCVLVDLLKNFVVIHQGNFIFKRKIKVINFLHKKTNTSNVLNFDVKNLKSNLNNRKPKKEIFFDNPFTGSSSSANSTQRFVCNKHISRITNNIKANKFTKQFNIKKHTKTLNTMEKTGKIIINNI